MNMLTHITQLGDIHITTNEQTEGYALLKWMNENRHLKGISIDLIEGGYTKLIIPSQAISIKHSK